MARIIETALIIYNRLYIIITDKRGEYNSDYYKIFGDYPDVVTIDQLRQMLGGICRNKAYELVRTGTIAPLPYIKTYKIPKINIINYVLGK